MIHFQRYILDNGLKILVHCDKSTPMVSVCLTYGVGTKDENPDRTGFAHLFEHLMFGGSSNAPNFDDFVQMAGGENNAFTNQDMTVYYEVMPKENLDVALWLEADRMEHLILSQEALDIQKKVVVEEFKETCINEPYGDIWHHIGPLVYEKHPYRVPTIGKTFEHIENANLQDVAQFFQQFYSPNNATLAICGNLDEAEVLLKVKQWFAKVPKTKIPKRKNNIEPPQQKARQLYLEANVPQNAIYLVFPSASRLERNYYLDDILSDVLAEGDAAPLYRKLVKDKELFTDIDAYITGTVEHGLFIVEGKLSEGVSFEKGEKAIWKELQALKKMPISIKELQKIQHRMEHNLEFGEINNLHKAINLAYYETLGNAMWINEEREHYQNVTSQSLQTRAKQLFQRRYSNTIFYASKKENK